MNRTVALVIAKAALAPAWRWASQPHRTGQLTPSRPPVIEEDSPQWDCRYDGNRICGVGATLPDARDPR